VPNRASPILVGLVGLWLVLLVIAVPLAFANSGTSLAPAPLWLAFGLVGALVARHQPRNPVGWLLFGVALFFTTESDASGVSVLDYRHHQGLPLGSLAVLLQPTWAAAIVAAGVAVLLFPDGKLPSPRWRWPLRLLLAIAAVWQLGAFAAAIDAIIRHSIRVDSGGNLLQTSHPHGDWAWWGVVQDIFFPAVGLYWIVWLVSQIPRYRRSTGERRLQLKWLLSGVSLFIVAGLLSVATPTKSELMRTVNHVAFIGLLALPICIGIAILRYRLYEIDRLISRTLTYAILTGVLAGVFIGIVVLATDVLPFSSPVAVAASTLAAAGLFNPLRGRVQRAVDRRFNRARYDAEAIVTAFTLRLRDAVDLDTVRGELLLAVERAVEPTHASLWIK
jgi:hypothetical protein